MKNDTAIDNLAARIKQRKQRYLHPGRMVDLILPCTCSRLGHVVAFGYFEDDYNELFVSVHLDRELSWWERLKVAVRYLFNRPCNYGEAAEITLPYQAVKQLRTLTTHVAKQMEKRAEESATERETKSSTT